MPGLNTLTPEAINAYVVQGFPGARIVCHDLGPDFAVARYDTRASDIRPGNYVSGPSQFALADSVLWYAAFIALGRIEPMAVTSELSIRYVRPAQGQVLWARATIESVARRQMVGSVRLWVDDRADKPCSVAQGTYVFPNPGET